MENSPFPNCLRIRRVKSLAMPPTRESRRQSTDSQLNGESLPKRCRSIIRLLALATASIGVFSYHFACSAGNLLEAAW